MLPMRLISKGKTAASLSLIVTLCLLLCLLSACGDDDNGDVAADGDFDGDGEQNATLTPPDCDMRRSLTNADVPVECLAWCNKVELVGGLDTTSEDCLRDCRAMTYELLPDSMLRIENCIVVTSKQSFEDAQDRGDLSANLQQYCMALEVSNLPLPPERQDVCEDLYETMTACNDDTASIHRISCLEKQAPLMTEDAFMRYSYCAEKACESNWVDCLQEQVCYFFND